MSFRKFHKFIEFSAQKATIIFVWSVTILLFVSNTVVASDLIDRRMQISLSIFPRILAVDSRIKDKLTSSNQVLLVFLYEQSNTKATDLTATLKNKIKNISGLTYTAIVVKASVQLENRAQLPSALFLTEQLSSASFAQVMAYAIQNHIIVFSPFPGDVERGATVGISITSKVKTFFNMQTLMDSEIEINPLILNISKKHE